MVSITRFELSKEEAGLVGLKEIAISRVGRVVALAGRNGSGKSRILNELLVALSSNAGYMGNVKHYDEEEEKFRRLIAEPSYQDRTAELASWKTVLHQILKMKSEAGRVKFDKGGVVNYLKFVPKTLSLADPAEFNRGEQPARFEDTKRLGAEVHGSCIFYIQELHEQWRDATHQNDIGVSNKEEIIESYKKLDSLIVKLLGTSLGQEGRDVALFGRRISQAGLSDGQKIILQLCVAIHAQGAALENTIFILDEPENHLHPSASIDLFKAIYEASDSSQVWVATHSIPLLAYLSSIDPMSLWYVYDGAAKNSGRNPGLVLESLLGDDEQLEKLRAFTSLPAQLAAINYAAESLLSPKVIPGSGGTDPQATQIQSVLAKLASSRSLSVLEFGAGKGRLLDSIASDMAGSGKKVGDIIDYFAYEPFPDGSGSCEIILNNNYGSGIKRYFNSAEDFFSSKADSSIDVVVMCNVLHEISPRQWLDVFAPGSLIMRSLSADGYLLLVEDQRIPIGEKAHEYGFILLDTSHLASLFKVGEADRESGEFLVDSQSQGRLKAHLISKKLLANIDSGSRNKAINELARTAKSKIAEIRSAGVSYANGLLHGFWTQQFANSSLFLSDFE